jgi:Dolichyl-phosphate-mannose-protein mannosyltransferase
VSSSDSAARLAVTFAKRKTGRQAPLELIYSSALFVIFVVAFFVRVWGIPHAEPIFFHVDEPIFVQRAVRIVASGDLNPHWFGHPGSFTIYGLSALYALSAHLEGTPLNELTGLYAADPTPFHVLGKYFIVFWSMLTLFGVWRLTRHFVSRWYALLAPLLLAAAPLEITLATTIRTDTQQTALLVLLCLCLVKGVRSRTWPPFVWAGALLGMATAVKWPSVVACIPIVVAAWLVHSDSRCRPDFRPLVRWVALAAGTSLVALFVTAPFALLDFGTVLRNVAQESRSTHLSATSPGFFSALLYYLNKVVQNGTWAGVLLAGCGAFGAARSDRKREHGVLLAFALVYLVFIASLNLRWPRWGLPLLPLVPLYASVGVEALTELVRERSKRPFLAPATTAIATLVLLLGCGSHLGDFVPKLKPNIDVQTNTWIRDHIPQGSKVLTEAHAPYLPRNAYEIYECDLKGRVARRTPHSKYYIPGGRLIHLKNVPKALAQVDYVMLGSTYERVKKEQKTYAHDVAVYEEILSRTERMKKLGSYEIRRVRKGAGRE